VENEIQTDLETEADYEPEPQSDSSLALIITLAALLLWFGFQSVQALRERGNLSGVKANQESALQEAEKIRLQFHALLAKTSELANQGHGGAKMVVDELQRRGLGAGPAVKPAEKPQAKPAK